MLKKECWHQFKLVCVVERVCDARLHLFAEQPIQVEDLRLCRLRIPTQRGPHQQRLKSTKCKVQLRAMAPVRGGYSYEFDCTPVSPLNEYNLHQYFLRKSIADLRGLDDTRKRISGLLLREKKPRRTETIGARTYPMGRNRSAARGAIRSLSHKGSV